MKLLGSRGLQLLLKMEDQRRQAAEKEAAARRATDVQVLEDAERLIAAWNERQAKRMPKSRDVTRQSIASGDLQSSVALTFIASI